MPLPTVNYKELEALKAEDTEEAKTELAKLVRPHFSSIFIDFRRFSNVSWALPRVFSPFRVISMAPMAVSELPKGS